MLCKAFRAFRGGVFLDILQYKVVFILVSDKFAPFESSNRRGDGRFLLKREVRGDVLRQPEKFEFVWHGYILFGPTVIPFVIPGPNVRSNLVYDVS